ncbi:MAG TPA: hypothetical protein VEY09_14995 [Pyrinomonadaceae bacterium]|nr:hypothetical protein [Pyrinomonadaceae bacterium]
MSETGSPRSHDEAAAPPDGADLPRDGAAAPLEAGAVRAGLAGLRRKFEFGDALLFFYLAVFVRQYLWVVEGNAAAWALTCLLSAAGALALVALKDEEAGRRPRQFWLVVGLPLLVAYALRAALPDTSFDVLNYRLVGAERALRGWPFLPGDFFPPFYPLNPAPDMLLGVFRHALGYRLGTSLNLLVLLWAAAVVERLLRPYLRSAWTRSLAALVVVWTEHAVFLVNNYMVDLLALPLLLEATRLALGGGEGGWRRAARAALLVGMAGALKPLNLGYGLPIALVYLHSLYAGGRLGVALRAVPAALAAFLFPVLPYSLYMVRETGSPLFPLYNAVFKSSYWPETNLYDGRWGPKAAGEYLLWPLRVAFDPSRTGEMNVYSGRVSLAVVAALLCLVLARGERRLRALAFVALVSAYAWGALLTGYARYSIFAEMVGGVMLFGFAASLVGAGRANGAEGPRMATAGAIRLSRPRWARSLAALLLCALAAQTLRATLYVPRYEWSMRPIVFADPRAHAREARFLLRDYDLRKFLNGGDRARLAGVGAWVQPGVLVSGAQSLLDPEAPILCAYVHDYFYSEAGRAKFERALADARGRGLAALCLEAEAESCRAFIRRWPLEITAEYPLQMPVYSPRIGHRMLLLSLRHTGEAPAP